jgi:methylmalonyl-CoA mutase N-terminal domain/subunit
MTDSLEAASHEYFRRIDDMGGVIPALETGFLQREIADASYVYQLEEDRRERITVGVNEYRTEEGTEIPLLRVDREGEKKQIDALNEVRRTRDNRAVAQCLKALEQAARNSENTMPHLIEAAKAYATLGEMMDVFRDVFGEYNPSWGY